MMEKTVSKIAFTHSVILSARTNKCMVLLTNTLKTLINELIYRNFLWEITIFHFFMC